jgi:hypothetical protein
MDSSMLTQQRKAQAQFATTVAAATAYATGFPGRPTTVNSNYPTDNDDVLTNLQGNVFVTTDQYSTIVSVSQYQGTPSNPTVPAAPTGLVATPAGTSVSVAFTAGVNNGSTITNYQYSVDGGATFVDAAFIVSPVFIPGLTLGTTYNIQLRAVNSVGPGVASATVTVTTLVLASAPTITSITGGTRQLSVAFTAPASTGGSPITNYKFSTDGGYSYALIAPASVASPLAVTVLSSDGATALANGTTYNVSIRAVTAVGDGAVSAVVSGTTIAVPSAPTALVNSPGNQQLSIAFTAGSPGGSAISNYQYSTDGGATFRAFSPVLLATPAVITTLSSDGTTALSNLTYYPVVLRAVNTQGAGTSSAVLYASTNNVPPAPESLSYTGGATSLTIAFTQPNTGGAGLTISNYSYSLNGAAYVSAGPAASPVTITGLSSSTTYTIRLKATNGLGTSDPSELLTASTFSVPPAPTQLSSLPSKPAGVTTLKIVFLQNGDGGSAITNYQYSTDNGATYALAGTAASPVTITTQSGGGSLVDQTTYQVLLKARNAIGDGPASAVLAARTSDVPAAPSSLSYVIVSGTAATVSFQQTSDGGSPITNYFYSINNGGSYTSTGTTSNSIPITGLTVGVTYAVRVIAANAFGNSAASASLSVVMGPPAAPATLVASKGNQQAVVNFTPGNQGGGVVTGYSYSLNGGISYTAVTPASNRFTVSSLTNASSYTITLKATNSYGDSLPSASVITRPTATTTLRIAAIGPGINAGDPSLLSNLLVTATAAQGYTVTPTVTPYTSLAGYTGGDLTPANYDCAAVWTDGAQVFNTTFGSNLSAYVANGGNLVMYGSAFGATTSIANTNYSNSSAFAFSTMNRVVSNSGLGTVTSIYHPTVANIPSLDLPSADIVSSLRTVVGTQGTTGATVTAFWPSANPSAGTSFVAIRNVGNANVVGVNLYLNTTGLSYASYSNYWKYMTNALYWAGGNLT